MRNYIAEIIDLTGDSYLNPVPAIYDNGTHIRKVSNITSVSVHHDATFRPHAYDSVARYKQEAAEHYLRLGPGIQYHYKIDNVGQIFKLRPHDTWLYVVGSSENTSTIAICLDGYFHPDVNQKPTREQYEALSQLIIELSENHPEFPATYKDVRPHSDFSSTACCGDTLRPYVLQVTNKATAQNIPADAVYDYPQEQPQPAPVPTPDPAKLVTSPIVEAIYVAQVKTHLDDVETGQRIADYQPSTEFDMVKRISLNGESWLQTAYSAQKFPTRGVPEKDLLVKHTDTPVPPSDPASVPTPPVPSIPPAPSDTSHLDERVSALEKLVKMITGFLDKTFKSWRL